MTRERRGRGQSQYETGITLALPGEERSKLPHFTEAAPAEKTSLYVPTSVLRGRVNFRPASFCTEVKVTPDVAGILETVFRFGDIASRSGPNGLENDPTRQQIIVYGMVVCSNHLLWYQRTSPSDIKTGKFLGDARLQGRFSIGFGGHITGEDIEVSQKELTFLKYLLPAINDGIALALGLSKGLFSEVEEEIGLERHQIGKIQLLGGFYDEGIEDPSISVQVGQVHTGIAAVFEVNQEAVRRLTLQRKEIAKAWWVPFEKVEQEFANKEKDWQEGRCPKVETWTEICLKEFWPRYFLLAK